MSTNNSFDTSPEAGHEFWRARVRRHMHAKDPDNTTYPKQVSEAIARVGAEQIVEELLDDLAEKNDVIPDWRTRKMIMAAVDSMIFDPKLTRE